MKTKISLLTGLITGLLFAAALPAAPLPGMDDIKNAVTTPKVTPTPNGVVPGPDDYKKLADEVKKATAGVSPASLPQAPGPEGIQDALNKAKGLPSENPAQGESKASTSDAQNSSLPYTFYDRYEAGSKPVNDDDILIGDYSKGPQSSSASDKTANNTYDGSPVHYNKPKPTSETEDWHKKNKNKKRHHDNDQDQNRYSGKKHWNENSVSSSDNSTYDGSPVHYTRPKPASETEDWHKKNKNKNHHHGEGNGRGDGSGPGEGNGQGDGNEGQGNAKPQGQKWLYLNLPKDGSSSTDMHGRHQENKKNHHHHGNDQDQGND